MSAAWRKKKQWSPYVRRDACLSGYIYLNPCGIGCATPGTFRPGSSNGLLEAVTAAESAILTPTVPSRNGAQYLAAGNAGGPRPLWPISRGYT